MKGKQLAIVLVLLVALGGAAVFLSRRNSASWKNSATSSSDKILNFPLNDVSSLTIKGGDGELNLVKKEEIWTVKERADYPADFAKVSALLRKLWELKPVQDVKVGPSQLGRLQLTGPGTTANAGTLLDLKGAGEKRLAALLVGKKQLRNSDQPSAQGAGVPVGRYVMAQDGSNRVFLISETLDEAQTKPEQWLSRDFFEIENPKLIAVAGTTPGMNWTVTRENASAPWKLLDGKPGEELDSAKVSSLGTLFRHASFADVLAPDAAAAETGLDKPATARIETFDNFIYELRIGKLLGQNYPLLVSVKADLPKERTPAAGEKPEDKTKLEQDFQARQKKLAEKLAKEEKLTKRPYLIAKTTIDQLLKERSALLAEKKPESSVAPAISPAGKKGAPLPRRPSAVPRGPNSLVPSSSPSPNS